MLAEPLRVDVHGEGGTAYAHVVFDVKPFAEAVIVLNHTGTGARSVPTSSSSSATAPR